MSITVSILQTGTIRIRPSHRTQTADRPVLLRRLRVLTERRWTPPLPINTYLIEHPEGFILVDSGECTRDACVLEVPLTAVVFDRSLRRFDGRRRLRHLGGVIFILKRD